MRHLRWAMLAALAIFLLLLGKLPNGLAVSSLSPIEEAAEDIEYIANDLERPIQLSSSDGGASSDEDYKANESESDDLSSPEGEEEEAVAQEGEEEDPAAAPRRRHERINPEHTQWGNPRLAETLVSVVQRRLNRPMNILMKDPPIDRPTSGAARLDFDRARKRLYKAFSTRHRYIGGSFVLRDAAFGDYHILLIPRKFQGSTSSRPRRAGQAFHTIAIKDAVVGWPSEVKRIFLGELLMPESWAEELRMRARRDAGGEMGRRGS